MTWTAFRTRGEILRAVADEADLRRDGALPWHLPDVAETFRDELDLVASLQLRWYTRLAGQVERHLVEEPLDLEGSVRRAWVATAVELPGIRAVLDRQAAAPATPDIGRALAKAAANEHAMLALMAGLAGTSDRRDPRAIEAGHRIEEQARASYRPGTPMPDPTHPVVLRTTHPTKERLMTTDETPTTPDVSSTGTDETREQTAATDAEQAPVERVPSGSASFVARLKAALAA